MTDVTPSLLALTNAYAHELLTAGNFNSAALRLIPSRAASNKQVLFAVVDGYSANGTENFADGADASNFSAMSQFSPALDFARFRTNKAITTDALVLPRLVVSPDANREQKLLRLKEAVREMTKFIGIQAYTGNGSNQIAGMNTALHDTLEYAGVNRSTNQGWRATTRACPAADVLKGVRLMQSEIVVRSGRPAKMALCHPTVWNSFVATQDANIRVRGDQGEKMLTFGFRGIELDDGCVLYRDPLAPTGKIYFIPEDTHWQYVPGAMPEEGFYPFIEPGVCEGSEKLSGFAINALGKTGSAIKFSVEGRMQLVVNEPQNGGILTLT